MKIVEESTLFRVWKYPDHYRAEVKKSDCITGIGKTPLGAMADALEKWKHVEEARNSLPPVFILNAKGVEP